MNSGSADRAASPAPVVQLFFNPASGSFSARDMVLLARGIEAAGARVIPAISSDTAEPLTIDRDASHICIAGGDGTIRHVATMLARRGCPLPIAIYPAGTVNLLAMDGGYAADPAGLVRRLFGEQAGKLHHPVAIGEELFFACASAGPDSAAIAALSTRLKRWIGRAAYLVAFLGVLWRWPRPRIILTADGRQTACEAFYVAKARYFAGRWSFAPQACPSDGMLHVVALPRAGRRDYARFIWAMLCGQKVPGVHFTCTTLMAQCDDPMPVQADGDMIATLPLTLTVDARAIAFR
ncbi:MAG TPA: diacylglycerol kinase family protein [Novosphingobium sp.]